MFYSLQDRFNVLTDTVNILYQVPCSHIVKENFYNRTCKSEKLNIDFLVETGHTYVDPSALLKDAFSRSQG